MLASVMLGKVSLLLLISSYETPVAWSGVIHLPSDQIMSNRQWPPAEMHVAKQYLWVPAIQLSQNSITCC